MQPSIFQIILFIILIVYFWGAILIGISPGYNKQGMKEFFKITSQTIGIIGGLGLITYIVFIIGK